MEPITTIVYNNRVCFVLENIRINGNLQIKPLYYKIILFKKKKLVVTSIGDEKIYTRSFYSVIEFKNIQKDLLILNIKK